MKPETFMELLGDLPGDMIVSAARARYKHSPAVWIPAIAACLAATVAAAAYPKLRVQEPETVPPVTDIIPAETFLTQPAVTDPYGTAVQTVATTTLPSSGTATRTTATQTVSTATASGRTTSTQTATDTTPVTTQYAPEITDTRPETTVPHITTAATTMTANITTASVPETTNTRPATTASRVSTTTTIPETTNTRPETTASRATTTTTVPETTNTRPVTTASRVTTTTTGLETTRPVTTASATVSRTTESTAATTSTTETFPVSVIRVPVWCTAAEQKDRAAGEVLGISYDIFPADASPEERAGYGIPAELDLSSYFCLRVSVRTTYADAVITGGDLTENGFRLRFAFLEKQRSYRTEKMFVLAFPAEYAFSPEDCTAGSLTIYDEAFMPGQHDLDVTVYLP